MFLKNAFRSIIPKIGTDNDALREAWIKRELSSLPDGTQLLDAGAGECRFKPDCSHLAYIAQDFCQYHGNVEGDIGHNPAAWDNSKIDVICDITSIPIADAEFDAVLCTEVLEHVPDPLSALKELTRVTRKGGLLLLSVPFTSMTHFAPFHYCTGFSPQFFRHHLPNLGWEIADISTSGNFYHVLAQELRRLRRVLHDDGSKTPFWYFFFAFIMLRFLERKAAGPTQSDKLSPYTVFVRAVRVQ